MKKRQEIISTKMSSEAWLRLNDIAQRQGISLYRLVQETLDTLILYMDEANQLSPEMQQVIDCFERFEGWGQLCRLTDVGVDWAVADAVYFLHDNRQNGMAGVTACWCKRGFMGTPAYTFNKKDILDMVIRRTQPDLWRELQLLGMQAGTTGALETIKHCIHNMLEDPDKETLREMFADCGRTDYGKSTELVKYIRHNRKNMEVPDKRVKPVQMELFNDDTE